MKFWRQNHRESTVQSVFTSGLLALVALGVSACVSTTVMPSPALESMVSQPGPEAFVDDLVYDDTERLLNAGFKGITERYLETVSARDLALGAIDGLGVIDPELRLRRLQPEVDFVLYYGEREIARFQPPEKNNIAGWAALTTELLRTARTFSPELYDGDPDEISQALFDGTLSELDAFSRYAGPDEAQRNRARRDGFGGIGISFTVNHGVVTITAIMNNTPAEAAGLLVGDRIISIAGERIGQRKSKWVSMMLRGPIGSHISLRLARATDTVDRVLSLHVLRAQIIQPTVTSEVEGKILTVHISSFNKNTASTLHDQLRQISASSKSNHIQGMVLDLRGNPGGLLMQSVNVADLFLENGAIVSTRGRHPDTLHNYMAGGIDVTYGLPMVVLIDGDSASAAEIVASALQDRGRAVVIGATSYGKGTAQTVLRLPNSGEITLTWSRLIAPSGYALHGLGVLPTLCTKAVVAQPQGTENKPDMEKRILAVVRASEAKSREWREMGQAFDERRALLRRNCPAETLKNDPETVALARNILSKSDAYLAAIETSNPRATAARQ